MTLETTFPSLISVLLPTGKLNSGLRFALLATVGSIVIAISSKIQIPLSPVPVTMQTFAVLTLGIAYGWRLGAVTLLLYLGEGALGLPVFAKGTGLAYMLGGTGGYLVGFVFAAAVCGLLAERGWDRSPLTTALAMLIGNVLIYIPGLLWLGVLFGWDKPILEMGLIPFIWVDLAKLALATAILPLLWKFVGQRKT